MKERSYADIYFKNISEKTEVHYVLPHFLTNYLSIL